MRTELIKIFSLLESHCQQIWSFYSIKFVRFHFLGTPRNPKIVSRKSNDKENIKPIRIERKSVSTSDEDEPIVTRTKQKTSSIQSTSDQEEEKEETPKQQRAKQRTPSIQSKSDREQEKETPKQQSAKQRTPSIQSKSDRDEQTDTPKQSQPTEKIHRKTPSIQSSDNDQTPKTNGKTKEESPTQTKATTKYRSPSFQSMNEEEAHYTRIFKKIDPDNTLDLHLSPPPTPIPRPKTRHGLKDKNDEHSPVAPLVGLDNLDNQTARSDDQLILNSLPSTTTDHTENHSRRPRTTDRDDEDD